MAKTSGTPVFLVYYGEEDYFLDGDIDRLRKMSNRTSIVVDGSDISEQELVSLCETRTIDDKQRTVILDNAHKFKGSKYLKSYIEERDVADTYCTLVAIVRSDKLPALWKEAAKKGKLVEHKKLKTWETKNEVIPWIETEATKIGLKLDHKMAELLFQYVGSNLYRLSNELQKLSLVVTQGKSVTKENLVFTVSPTSTVEPFQVVEAAADKNVLKALNGLARLYKNSGDDPSIPLAYGLMKLVERLLIARFMLDKKVSEDDIAIQLGMNPWRCKNFFIPQVKKHSVGNLVYMMQRLCGLDMEMKRASSSRRTNLELAIIALAT